MALIDAVAQMAMKSKDDSQKAFDDMTNMVKIERVKRIGKRFMDQGDFSPQGIMNFAKAENVQIDEMQTIVQLVGEFQKIQKQGSPPNRFVESERGILDQQSGSFSRHPASQAAPGSPFAKLLRDREMYPAGSPEREAIDMQIAKQNEPTSSGGQPSSFGKLLSEMNSLPEGDPGRAMYQQKIAKEMAQTGMSISVDKDGNVQVLTNADQSKPQGEGLQKSVAAKVQTELIDLNEQLGRVMQIKKGFKKEYLDIETRLKHTGTKWGEKLGLDVEKEDVAGMTEFFKYKMSAMDDLNKNIQAITGAAMTDTEVPRLMAGMPNVGQGIFDGDSSSEFKGKLEATTATLKRAVMRLNYVNKNGLKSFDQIPLSAMDDIVKERGAEIESQIKAKMPNAEAGEINRKLREQLKAEFGMDF